ncbi:MAG: hypothetical protein ACK55Z_27815 [bacterium]
MLASKGNHVPALDDSKKDLGSSFTIFPLGCHVFCVPQRWLCTVHLYWRRGGADK